MILRRIVVFSGFDGKVVERLRGQLESQQTDVVAVKRMPQVDPAYFDRLFDRFCVISKPRLADKNVRIVAILVSSLSITEELALERKTFWPILRRLEVEKRLGTDVNRATGLGQQIITQLSNLDFLATYKRVKPAKDAVLSLPVKNVASRRLETELNRLYDLEALQPAPSLDRFIMKLKKGGGLSANGLHFKGCVNDESHPIRRVTNSDRCDIEGRLRLGFSVPMRFEFDVSCPNGLQGKTFQLCDGSSAKIPNSATHLNMRINGDFDHP